MCRWSRRRARYCSRTGNRLRKWLTRGPGVVKVMCTWTFRAFHGMRNEVASWRPLKLGSLMFKILTVLGACGSSSFTISSNLGHSLEQQRKVRTHGHQLHFHSQTDSPFFDQAGVGVNCDKAHCVLMFLRPAKTSTSTTSSSEGSSSPDDPLSTPLV